MQEYISQNLTAIIVAIVGLFAAGLVLKLTIRYFKQSNKNSFNTNSNNKGNENSFNTNSNINSNNDSSYNVSQKDNVVIGDQAGRDINKK